MRHLTGLKLESASKLLAAEAFECGLPYAGNDDSIAEAVQCLGKSVVGSGATAGEEYGFVL